MCLYETINTENQGAFSTCELGFNLKRKSVTVPHTDILIATCALQSGSIIVHADAHFDMMAKHAVIKVESFVEIVRDFSRAL